MTIKDAFINTLDRHSVNSEMQGILWGEIELHYNESDRYYHNLSHINHIWSLLGSHTEVEDPETVLFSTIYHDIIYEVSQNDNEEKSAKFAANRLNLITWPSEKIEKCRQQILATKNHSLSTNNDTNLFIDADLAI